MKTTKQIIIRILPWAVVGAVGWFFYKMLVGNLHKLEDVNFTVDLWAIVGMILFTLAVVVSGMLWGHLLSKLAARPVSTVDSIRIHSASWLLKYVPGQVGSYLNKIAWGTKRGISKQAISTSFIYENVLMVIAGIALSAPVVVVFGEVFGDNLSLVAPVLVAIPLSVVLSRKLFYFLVSKMFGLIGKKPFARSDFLTSRELIVYQVGYLIPRLLNGIGFVFIVQSLVVVAPDMYIGLAATYILASIVGLLAVFVPGGLGVREAVIVVFLSVYFPVEQAIVISLVTRLYATVSDLGVGLIYIALNKGRIRQQ